MSRQVIFAAKAGVTRWTYMLPETSVSVLMPSEILGCKKFLLALWASELSVLRWPGRPHIVHLLNQLTSYCAPPSLSMSVSAPLKLCASPANLYACACVSVRSV